MVVIDALLDNTPFRNMLITEKVFFIWKEKKKSKDKTMNVIFYIVWK